MNKKEALEKYEKAKSEGKVDDDIISLLDKINEHQELYTTSSCSGRIVILNIPSIGDKKNARFLCKWHTLVKNEEIEKCLENYEKDYLFLIMQSPIIHVIASNIDWANKIMKISRECGFKYTTIKEIKNTKVLVEILSTENLHIPLGEKGNIKIDYKDLEFFTEIANKLLLRAKKKLKCLEEKFSYLLLSSS